MSLINHLKSIHQSKIDPAQTFSFNDETEFLSWKEREETKTFSYYPKTCGKKSSDVNSRNYYYCQHSGSDAAHRKEGEQARKTSRKRKIGQIKQNFTCISKITEVIFANGNREVVYYPTHNHPLSEQDIPHQPVPASVNNLINTQIALNVPALEIHHSVQANVSGRDTRSLNCGNEDKRKIAVSKRLIQQRIGNRKHKSRLHANDIVSVSLKVEELKHEQYNPVVIFKPTGSTIVSLNDEEHVIDENIFMLGIQTESQRNLMFEGCKKILVMDDTHCVTQYDAMKLLNILIVDKNNKGWPVGHFICNNMTGSTIELFFKALKNRMLFSHQEDFTINCLITDDDPALINGLQSAMGHEIKHILCQWHLLNAFKDNIRSKCPGIYDVVYTDLKTIILEKNVEDFKKLINGFRAKYSGKADSFIKYMDSYYFHRCEKWAMCFRQNLKHGNVNTTAHVESFHNKLKKVYFQRKPNKRMDDLLDVLFTIEQDDYAARQRETIFNCNLVEDLVIDRRHNNGMEIADACIHKINDFLWGVQSLPNNNMTYQVYQFEKTCSHDFCFVKCTKSSCHNLCSHMYTCSCPDSLLCKHIHKVHSLVQRNVPNPTLENLGEPEEVEFFNVTHETEESTAPAPSVSNAYKKLQADLSILTTMVNGKKIPDHLVSPLSTEINGILKKYTALSSEIYTSTVETTTINIPNQVTVAPRQKLITQQQQTLNPLKRKDTCKKKNFDLNILMSQRKAARHQLLSLDVQGSQASTSSLSQASTASLANNVSDVHDYCLRE
ncbi:hypothetical protein M8J75_009490 [Diaphorina citri]|nr:hypothetical protein M8J75_009490 [Diaphorina citri]